MSRAGLLVSIDGPGGAGKSTVLGLVNQSLTGRGLRTCPTTKPSSTPLGNLIRASTDTYTGMSLACLVAGDRHHHLATLIRPNLAAGAIVLTDRYLPSSLVLQRIDGAERGGPHSRFERSADGPSQERELYRDAAARLAALGWNICEIDTTAITAAQTAAIITSRIISQVQPGES